MVVVPVHMEHEPIGGDSETTSDGGLLDLRLERLHLAFAESLKLSSRFLPLLLERVTGGFEGPVLLAGFYLFGQNRPCCEQAFLDREVCARPLVHPLEDRRPERLGAPSLHGRG